MILNYNVLQEDELDFNPRHAKPMHECEYRDMLSIALGKLHEANMKLNKKNNRISDIPAAEVFPPNPPGT